MFLRISSAIIGLSALAACAQGEAQPQASAGAEPIDCAIGPGAEFGPDCLVEKTQDGDAQLLVVRHPDGGFRRLEQLPDGKGLAAYDGADTVQQSLEGGVLSVTVGTDRYRFAARSQGGDAGS